MSHNVIGNQDKLYAVAMIKKLLSNARAIQNGGSLTILALVDKTTDENLKFELKELCNMCIVLNEKTYLKHNKIWFDVLESNTRKAHLLLTEEEYNNLEQFKNDLNEDNKDDKTKSLEHLLLKQLK
jgi:transcription termination factor Rho